MFEAVKEKGGLGKTELEMASVADEVSRKAGFGGRIRMRKWPMDCDRVVIVAGKSASVPSYFDSAIGGIGANPISSLGSGMQKWRLIRQLLSILYIYTEDMFQIVHVCLVQVN